MKIIAMVENETTCDWKTKKGLSLYIATSKHKILFDVGPDDTLFENSRKCKVNLSDVDTVIISHGHMDHGGALEKFLQMNTSAKVYIQKTAFEKHYSKVSLLKINVGMDDKLLGHPQIVMLDGGYKIDEELELFTVDSSEKCYSNVNDVLFTENRRDQFEHEQNLMIHGEKNVLVMGCGHKGVVNILEKARQYRPEVCIGGYHLFNPITNQTVSTELLDEMIKELASYDIVYYTCHCTGKKAYHYLAERMKSMHYLSCGDTLEL